MPPNFGHISRRVEPLESKGAQFSSLFSSPPVDFFRAIDSLAGYDY